MNKIDKKQQYVERLGPVCEIQTIINILCFDEICWTLRSNEIFKQIIALSLTASVLYN